ncbi:MAG: hypothetical protein ABH879_02140 [archaeon]
MASAQEWSCTDGTARDTCRSDGMYCGAENMFLNGGFELPDASGRHPDGFFVHNNQNVRLDSSVKYEGRYSAKLSGRWSGYGQNVTVREGAQYYLYSYAYGNCPIVAYYYNHPDGSSRNLNTEAGFRYFSVSGSGARIEKSNWTILPITFTAPESITMMKLRVECADAGPANMQYPTMWVDAMHMSELDLEETPGIVENCGVCGCKTGDCRPDGKCAGKCADGTFFGQCNGEHLYCGVESNRLQNAGFEAATNGVPDLFSRGDKAYPDGTNAYMGLASARLDSQWASYDQDVRVQPNTEYVFSAFLRGKCDSLRLFHQPAGERAIDLCQEAICGRIDSDRWRRFEARFNTGQYAQLEQFRLECADRQADGQAYPALWVDAMNLDKVGRPQLLENCGVCGCPDGSTCGTDGTCGRISPAGKIAVIQEEIGCLDVNCDGKFGFDNLFAFGDSFGTREGEAGYDSRFDMNNDRTVNSTDFEVLNDYLANHPDELTRGCAEGCKAESCIKPKKVLFPINTINSDYQFSGVPKISRYIDGEAECGGINLPFRRITLWGKTTDGAYARIHLQSQLTSDFLREDPYSTHVFCGYEKGPTPIPGDYSEEIEADVDRDGEPERYVVEESGDGWELVLYDDYSAEDFHGPATIKVAVNNKYSLYVNGQLIGGSGRNDVGLYHAELIDGENVIAFTAKDDNGGDEGLIFEVYHGGQLLAKSDGTWRAKLLQDMTDQEKANWQSGYVDTSSWEIPEADHLWDKDDARDDGFLYGRWIWAEKTQKKYFDKSNEGYVFRKTITVDLPECEPPVAVPAPAAKPVNPLLTAVQNDDVSQCDSLPLEHRCYCYTVYATQNQDPAACSYVQKNCRNVKGRLENIDSFCMRFSSVIRVSEEQAIRANAQPMKICAGDKVFRYQPNEGMVLEDCNCGGVKCDTGHYCINNVCTGGKAARANSPYYQPKISNADSQAMEDIGCDDNPRSGCADLRTFKWVFSGCEGDESTREVYTECQLADWTDACVRFSDCTMKDASTGGCVAGHRQEVAVCVDADMPNKLIMDWPWDDGYACTKTGGTWMTDSLGRTFCCGDDSGEVMITDAGLTNCCLWGDRLDARGNCFGGVYAREPDNEG